MKCIIKLFTFLIGFLLLFTYISCENNLYKPIYYNVMFNSNGGSIVSNQTIESGKNAEKPLNPTKESTGSIIYIFDNWYSDNLLTTVFDFSTPVTKDMTLYAKWIEKVITYTVTFNSNGGDIIQEQIIEKGNTVTEPTHPSKKSTSTEQYTFLGWYSDEALTSIFDFSDEINSDITLYAKWSVSIITYSVVFNSNGGTEIESQTITSGSYAKIPGKPIRYATLTSAYKFAGWYMDTNFQKEFNFFTKVTEDIILYAKWTEKEIQVPDNFVYSIGGTIDETIDNSTVFISSRTLNINDMYVCNHEVTQSEYEKYCSYGGSVPNEKSGKGNNYPVYYVNWYDAIVYCNLRSLSEGLTPVYSIENERDPRLWPDVVNDVVDGEMKYCGPSVNNSLWNNVSFSIKANGYRLPTEAEWEYIARGGNNGAFPIQTNYCGSNSISEVAWYYTNSDSKTHEVKLKESNFLGLYDMSGNVFEMCYDFWGPITSSTGEFGSSLGGLTRTVYRVVRGGSWYNNDKECTVSYRIGGTPEFRGDIKGFRVVRSD